MPSHPGTGFGTRSHPPLSKPDLWEVTYEVDWTGESADWDNDGGSGSTPHTIQGVSGGVGNAGTASLLAANSNGFQGTPSAAGDFVTGSIDAPRIAARIELLVPGWNALDTICFQALFTSSATLSNEDALGFAITTTAHPDTAGAMFYTVRQVYNSGVKDSLYGAHIDNSSSADYASTSGGSMMEMVLFPGNGVSALISGSKFVDPLTETGGYKAFGTMPDLRAIGPTGALSLEPGNTGDTDAYLQIYAGRTSSGSGFTATMTKFRVLKAKRSV